MLTLDNEGGFMNIIQDMTLFFSILTLITMVYWGARNKRIRLYLVPVGLWISHIIIFYIARILDSAGIIGLHNYDRFLFTNWSAYLRFHGVFTVFYFVVIESDIVNEIKRVVKSWMKIY